MTCDVRLMLMALLTVQIAEVNRTLAIITSNLLHILQQHGDLAYAERARASGREKKRVRIEEEDGCKQSHVSITSAVDVSVGAFRSYLF